MLAALQVKGDFFAGKEFTRGLRRDLIAFGKFPIQTRAYVAIYAQLPALASSSLSELGPHPGVLFAADFASCVALVKDVERARLRRDIDRIGGVARPLSQFAHGDQTHRKQK